MTTTQATYESDLTAATALMSQFVDPEQCEGNGSKWIGDALNNAWDEGLTIAQWVAAAVSEIPAGARRA